ncbi:MAG: hypothetical protein N3C60_01280 [Calditerrivibrio sp.]|nr:hypothetical protein [Calditerrivibrio sp.]
MANKTLNSNVTHKGKIYHVQTEIVGDKVITQVFVKGRVIFSYKDNFIDYETTKKQHRTAEAAIIRDKLVSND